MIPGTGLRWIVTVVFAAVGVFCLYRCVRHGPPMRRTCDVLHVLMCAGMVAMAWPAAMGVARVPQVLLFAAAAAWFVGMLVLGTEGHGSHGRLSLGHHALMMGGMAWTLLAMPMAMAGMTMSTDTPPHVVIVAVVLTAVFVLAGVGRLARAIDAGRGEGRLRLRTAGLAVDGVMSLGMALMTALLI
ncbi:DUF5134 domain-containing protein [Amycolatopsis acidiphila]|uniref:DUF5134 domain-containing protein n=1 Tax=Amycolatopsis acidiphila TaxID=715473 RepID=A0A558AM21_9PSEU|nr:DUF5134 domain-containing protein [Amycolatopsis acidiphila]TVT25290.1 DUF5134 domain-containing protein [Amycolatopsis acidiphila]UIJ62413.1 DUF5134 domain-containing protein [Amycolatopsis acidiphila]GHG83551.1 DUF5134 domain-containing protein [Amycolatopsis acidiphila]